MTNWVVVLALVCACSKKDSNERLCADQRTMFVDMMTSYKKGLSVEVANYTPRTDDPPAPANSDPLAQRLDAVQAGIGKIQVQHDHKHHDVQVKLLAAYDAAASAWKAGDPMPAMKTISDLEDQDAAADNEARDSYTKLKPDADSLAADAAKQPNKSFTDLCMSSKKLIDDNVAHAPFKKHDADAFLTEFQQKCQTK